MSKLANQFKGTSMAALKDQDDRTQAATGGRRFLDHNIKKIGKYRFRIYPGHDGHPFMMPCSVSFLPIEREKKEEGKTIKKIIPFPIFNARMHGGLKQDIVELYVTFAEKVIKADSTNPTEQTRKLTILNGGKKDGKFIGTVRPQMTWKIYADLLNSDGSKVFARLGVPYSIKSKFNKIAVDSSDPNDPIVTDPFSDPTEGRIVTITTNGNDDPKKEYYDVTIDLKGPTPLTDEELEEYLTVTPLHKLYINSYKYADFELQIEGLQRYDKEHGFGVFGFEEFGKICADFRDSIQHLRNDNPETLDEEADTQPKEVKSVPTRTNLNAPAVSYSPPVTIVNPNIDFSLMDRTELKLFNRDKQLGAVIKMSMSDDDVKNTIKQAWEAKNSDVEEVDDIEEEDDGLPWKKDGTDKPGRGPSVIAKEAIGNSPTTESATSKFKDRFKKK